jgi:molybdopterin converting factor small subunit
MRPGDPGADRQFTALGDLLLYLGDRGPVRTDPRTYALWIVACHIGDPDCFEMTPTMRDLIARLGARAEKVPTPDETLTELTMAAVEDLAEALQRKVGAANRERDEADEKARLNASAVTRAQERDTELKEAREVIAGLTGELEEAQASLTFLRERGSVEPEPKATAASPKKPDKPRRTSVDGETGIYFNEAVEGRPYEINYRDADKKQHWETIGFDLEEARARRALLNGQSYLQGVAA